MSRPGTGVPRRAAVAAGLALLVPAAVLGSALLGESAARACAGVVQLAAAAVAALAAASAGGRSAGRARWAWVAVALGCASWAAGAGVATWHDVALQTDAPSPLAADLGYLALPLAVAVAVLVHPGTDSSALTRGRRFVDAAVAAAGLLIAHLGSTGAFDDVLVDLGWVAGFAVIGLAATAAPVKTATEDGARGPSDLLPYVPVALSSLVVVDGVFDGRMPSSVQAGLIGLVAALVLTRLCLMLRENAELAERLAAREEQLRHQAFHDDLTGLANRALFLNRLEHALDLHGRDLRQVSVLYLDIDDFKVVNDTLGHAAGDELLVRVSERLLAALRTGDTVARVGGDEFAALLEDGGDPVTAAAGVAAALRPPFVLRGSQVRVAASIGVVALEPSDALTTADSLLAQADTAMYDAKRRGKAQLSVYRNGMALPEVADTRTAAGLEGALSGGELRLVYQPVMGLADGHIESLEALSRWLHEGRHVEPADFLPAAVRTGVVADLTEWVLGEACHQAATWSHAMRRPVSVGVNVAGPQIADPTFVAIVDGVLRRHGLQPEQLVLDVTEASLSANPQSAARVVNALRATGIRVAVDDFGIGPSSLSLLHEVGADMVKIDVSVIEHLDRDALTVPFVRSLVQLGDALGLQVIAEGIERPEQLDMLLDLGCRLGQGHLLARPMDAVAVLETLVARGSAARP